MKNETIQTKRLNKIASKEIEEIENKIEKKIEELKKKIIEIDEMYKTGQSEIEIILEPDGSLVREPYIISTTNPVKVFSFYSARLQKALDDWRLCSVGLEPRFSRRLRSSAECLGNRIIIGLLNDPDVKYIKSTEKKN